MGSTTRRAILGAIACAPAAAILAAPLPRSASPDQSAWSAALAAYRKADREYDAAWDRYYRIEEAASAVTPDRPNHLFDKLHLSMSMSRHDAEAMIRYHVLSTGEQIDIAATVDGFERYQAAVAEVRQRFNLAEESAKAQTLSEPLHAARDALMATPAPDTAALLIKIEITSHCICEEHAVITLADARRLLRGEG